MRSSGGAVWDQFAENERRFGIKTDYDENIYTTTIDKTHPQYKQRMAEADKKAKEIINKAAFNSHVAEERVQDNVGGDDGVDEEDKYALPPFLHQFMLTSM
jgi:PAB1-binding protein PBP1